MTDKILHPDSFDFLVDDSKPDVVIALRANPLDGDSVIIPLTVDSAAQVGELLLAHTRLFSDGQRFARTPAKARMMRYPAGVAD